MKIKSAKEMANETVRTEKFEKACESVMRKIEEASKEGKHLCLFCPTCGLDADLEYSVKKEFIKAGYTFEPYGYCNGVWQDCENICW